MADPDEALIEAIAAEACEPDANFMFCTVHQTDSGQWPCPVGPRAAFAAMVEHLGLVEETIPAGYWAKYSKPARRFKTPWVEVDHG